MEPPPRPSRLAVLATLAAAAVWFAVARTGISPFDAIAPWWSTFEPPAGETQLAAFDVYAHFLPIMAYAGQALRAGGGLFWTPLQNCGQPFAAYNGLLYPLHWLPVLFCSGSTPGCGCSSPPTCSWAASARICSDASWVRGRPRLCWAR